MNLFDNLWRRGVDFKTEEEFFILLKSQKMPPLSKSIREQTSKPDNKRECLNLSPEHNINKISRSRSPPVCFLLLRLKGIHEIPQRFFWNAFFVSRGAKMEIAGSRLCFCE
jgi:hypothetical protein